MYVVATAGHVDHGKSTLVRALTEMDPDRWEEEKRRGLTIDLGFAWTTLPSGADVAFVDVPGHEKFLGNMLAGVGPAPVVLFVVAADEGWQAQSTDHRDALRALGVEHGIIALTRSDRATVDRTAEIRAELADTPLADAPSWQPPPHPLTPRDLPQEDTAPPSPPAADPSPSTAAPAPRPAAPRPPARDKSGLPNLNIPPHEVRGRIEDAVPDMPAVPAVPAPAPPPAPW